MGKEHGQSNGNWDDEGILNSRGKNEHVTKHA